MARFVSNVTRNAFRMLLLSVASAATLHAQDRSSRTHTTGFMLGVGSENNVAAAYPGRSNSNDGYARGTGYVVGYGFTRALTAYVGFGIAGPSNNWAGSADLGMRYHLKPVARVVVPFLQAAVSDRLVTQDVVGRSGTVGTGFGARVLPGVGAGANVYLTSALAVSASAMWNGGRFTSANGASSSGDAAFRVLSPKLHVGMLLVPGAWLGSSK